MDYDAIIVGGGLAGLTAAAYLCKAGHSVLLCEKEGHTGGLVNSFSHRGFVFDGGIRAFENSGILFPMLRQLGIEMEFVKNPVTLQIEDRAVHLKDQSSLGEYGEMLRSLFPRSHGEIDGIIEEIHRVMSWMDVLYGIDNPLFIDNLQDREYLLHTLLPWLVQYQKKIGKAQKLSAPIREHLRKFTGDVSLIDMISQHFFANTPAFFALSYFGLYLDYCYPLGGTGVLAQKVTEYITAHGGTIAANTAIAGLDVPGRRVFLSNTRAAGYRQLVWAADSKFLYQLASASGNLSLPAVRQKALADQGSGGDSILSFFMAADLTPDFFAERCGPHAFYTPHKKGVTMALPESWEGILHNPSLTENKRKQKLKDWLGSYLRHTTYEISVPCLRDPSLAPPGQTGVIASTLLDYSLIQAIADMGWYDECKEFCLKMATEALDAGMLPGLSSRILFSHCSTPLTIRRLTGNSGGAITGWAFTGGRNPAETRLKKIARSVRTPLPGIFQAGQWTFSPSGLPISILTGKLAADGAAKALKKKP